MSKINITLDTESKELAVKVGKEVIVNVREVSIYQYTNAKGEADGFQAYVTVSEEVDGIRKVTNYIASASEEGQKLLASDGEYDMTTIPDFIGVAGKTSVQEDIEKYLSN